MPLAPILLFATVCDEWKYGIENLNVFAEILQCKGWEFQIELCYTTLSFSCKKVWKTLKIGNLVLYSLSDQIIFKMDYRTEIWIYWYDVIIAPFAVLCWIVSTNNCCEKDDYCLCFLQKTTF